jgi:hypothetical protein
MLPSLPQEILDLIADHLHNEPTTLKACCVVSKSWIPRTRKHLFASVEFHDKQSHIELWKEAFPDPSTSPARYTRRLSIRGIQPIIAADTDVGGWIRAFRNLAHLHLESIGREDRQVSLVPFHGLSPTLKSLSLTFITLEVLDLICSFPLLDDLALFPPRGGDNTEVWNTPSTSPKLTGSLTLRTFGGILPVSRRLVGLPGGLRFTKIMIGCIKEDVKSTMYLVSMCTDTLEYLGVYHVTPGVFISAPMSSRHLTRIHGSRCVRDASA